MNYRISELVESVEKSIRIETECDPYDAQDDYRIISPIYTDGSISYNDGKLYLEFSLKFRTRIVCCMCAEVVETENNIMTEDCIPLAEFLESYGDDFEFCTIIRDLILLQVPIQILCSESCKGLCPVCGCNRNDTECQCESQERINPQFAALKEWMDNQE